MLLAGFCGTASAAKRHPLVKKDGRIHACYKVKGKPKGMLRVVRSAKARCRRGERKVAWTVAAAQGVPGVAGQPGAQGGAGDAGTSAPSAPSSGGGTAALETQIASLTFQVEALEGVLQGITNGDLLGLLSKLQGVTNDDLLGMRSTLQGVTNQDLTGVLGTLDGITNQDLTGVLGILQGVTNEDLLGAIGAVPVLATACDTLAGQSNALSNGLDGLIDVLAGVPLIGAIFGGIGIPAALDPLAICPQPES